MTDSGGAFSDDQTRTLLIELLTDYVNRGYRARDAVGAAIKALGEYMGTAGRKGEIRITEEAFELLVLQVQSMIDKYRAAQEKGAVPVGGGVYAEVVGEDEYAEIVKRESGGGGGGSTP